VSAVSAASNGDDTIGDASDNGVRLHNDQDRAPVRPRFGQHDPKQPIPMAENRTLATAFRRVQLLTKRQVFECDGAMGSPG
jgi:hypothetical protein